MNNSGSGENRTPPVEPKQPHQLKKTFKEAGLLTLLCNTRRLCHCKDTNFLANHNGAYCCLNFH